RRHTRSKRDWSSDVCSSDLGCVSERRRSVASGNPPSVGAERRSIRSWKSRGMEENLPTKDGFQNYPRLGPQGRTLEPPRSIAGRDRKSTRLNSSHVSSSYAV